MSGAAIAAVVVGTGISVYSQIQAGSDANKAARRNAELTEQAGRNRIQVRKAEAQFQSRKFLVESGYKEALGAFSGAEGFGDIIVRDWQTFAEEQLLLDYNAEFFNVQAQNNANVQRFEGAALKRSATTGAIGTGIAGLGTAAIGAGATTGLGGGTGASSRSISAAEFYSG